MRPIAFDVKVAGFAPKGNGIAGGGAFAACVTSWADVPMVRIGAAECEMRNKWKRIDWPRED